MFSQICNVANSNLKYIQWSSKWVAEPMNVGDFSKWLLLLKALKLGEQFGFARARSMQYNPTWIPASTAASLFLAFSHQFRHYSIIQSYYHQRHTHRSKYARFDCFCRFPMHCRRDKAPFSSFPHDYVDYKEKQRLDSIFWHAIHVTVIRLSSLDYLSWDDFFIRLRPFESNMLHRKLVENFSKTSHCNLSAAIEYAFFCSTNCS